MDDDFNARAKDPSPVPLQPKRRSMRLKGYDYSLEGVYFVTVCTQNRQSLFGEILDGVMRLNRAGNVARNCWNDIPSHFPQTVLDRFVIMPNHVHGIISIVGSPACPSMPHPCGTAKTIGSVVRGFKIGVTKWLRNNTPIRAVWQRNYWDRIVRNEAELDFIREYVQNNPAQWELDKLNPCTGAVMGGKSDGGNR